MLEISLIDIHTV